MSGDGLTGFARRLKAVRNAFGTVTGNPNLPRAQYAALLGVASEAYRRYERGEIEPGFALLRKVREVTGISLDYLIADQDWGIANATELAAECTATFGDRVRWTRELFENDVKKVAKAFGVRPETYRRWESGHVAMPEAKQEEFATRFNVSLRFLQQGLPVGVPHDVLTQLRKAHPELWKLPPPLEEALIGADPPLDNDMDDDENTNGPPGAGPEQGKIVSLG